MNLRLNYEHLKHVIGVSKKFDDYLLEVKDQAPGDDWAREVGIR